MCNEYRAVLDAYNFLLSLEKSNKVTWEILQHELAQIEANWARIFIVFLDRMLQSFILFDKRKVMLKNSHQVPKVIGYLRELAIVLGKKKPEEKDILDHFLKKMFEVANAFKQ